MTISTRHGCHGHFIYSITSLVEILFVVEVLGATQTKWDNTCTYLYHVLHVIHFACWGTLWRWQLVSKVLVAIIAIIAISPYPRTVDPQEVQRYHAGELVP